MKLKLRYIILVLFILIALVTLSDKLRISNYKQIPSLPAHEKKGPVYDIYYKLVNNQHDEIKWRELNSSLEYINKQYDVSDFLLSTLVRILYDFNGSVPDTTLLQIKNTLLGFRYWMDEPGENSMCYWSENHQILFASAEYLIGQLYPDEIFTNSGLTGRQHMDKAVIRILDWLEMRWKFGFTEFYSNVYYNEDIAGLINIIDYARNDEIVKKSEIIMDLLLYDIASQKFDNTSVTVSGRAYEKGRKGGEHISVNKIINYIWGDGKKVTPHINYGFISSKNYKIPSALIEIGNDTSTVVIKQQNGLNIVDLKTEGYYGADEKSIMMQWAMEAFPNPEIVRNTLEYVRKNNMFSNEFIEELKYLDFSILNIFHLEPLLIKAVNPQSTGAAIQQANTYTYKTKDYSLYTAQKYQPGNYADQVHVTGMNVGDTFAVFHSHPAVPDTVESHSPSYWVGYGRLPHAAQDSSVSLSIYNLPNRESISEMYMLDFTHAYFPKEKFDSVYITQNYAFGKKGNTYCALIGRNTLHYKNGSTDDLLQNGRQTFWIIEAGSRNTDYSFDNFRNRILNNKLGFDEKYSVLTYNSNGKEYYLKFNGGFAVNGKTIETEYDRYNSPYIKAPFKPDTLRFEFKNKFLYLDFYKIKREFN